MPDPLKGVVGNEPVTGKTPPDVPPPSANEEVSPPSYDGPATYPQKCRGIVGFLFGHKFTRLSTSNVLEGQMMDPPTCWRCGMVPHV